MKFKIHVLLLLLLLSSTIELQAQTSRHFECGLVEESQNQNQHMSLSALSAPTYSGSVDINYLNSFPSITFNIYFWVIKKSDGTADEVITRENILRELNNVNEFFLPMGICFVLQGVGFINSDQIYPRGTFFSTVSNYAQNNNYVKANCFNVYVHPDIGDANGVTNYGSNRIAIDSWVIMGLWEAPRQLLAHELAHTFGLTHVWGSNNSGATTDEHVTRNQSDPNYNALTAGDMIHDTAAMTSFWGEANARALPIDSIVDKTNCLYIGIRKDSQGTDFSLTPFDVGNPMGATWSPCVQSFTIGQGIRIREYIDGSPTSMSVQAMRANNSTTTLSVAETNKSFIYQYSSNIIVNNNYNTSSAQDISLIAGDYIILDSNIDLKEGSTVVAEIKEYGCIYDTGNNMRKASQADIASVFEETTGLKLYPNPNNGSFDVTLGKEINGNINVEVYDISGKVIYKDNKQGITFNISVPNLLSGMYIVRLSSGDYNETIKFVKN